MKKIISLIASLLISVNALNVFANDIDQLAKEFSILIVTECSDNPFPNHAYCQQKSQYVKNILINATRSVLDKKIFSDIIALSNGCYNLCMQPEKADGIIRDIVTEKYKRK